MAEIRMTKSELRAQRQKLEQLQKYLPTLQLKKALLQAEIQEARQEVTALKDFLKEKKEAAFQQSGLLSDTSFNSFKEAIRIADLRQELENIAGVQVPKFISLSFQEYAYSLLETPDWTEAFIALIHNVITAKIRFKIALDRQEALEKELKDVFIKVNLFEKILIPKAQTHIRKIRVFLGDQLLASVSQSKVAKRNIERYLQKKKAAGEICVSK